MAGYCVMMQQEPAPGPDGEARIPDYSKAAVIRRAFWASLISFSPSLLMALIWVLLGSPGTPDGAISSSVGRPDLLRAFATDVIFGPLIQTAIFHLLVIEALLRLNLRKAIHIVPIAALLFVAAHLTNAFGSVSAFSFIPGAIVFPYIYLYWRQQTGSWRVASAATWLTHALHNLYLWGLNFVPASVAFG
jgi:hypothetical protein